MASFKEHPVFAKLQVARLQAKAGNKKEALVAAKAALAEVKKGGELPAEPFETFLKSIEDGEPMTFRGYLNAMDEARESKRKTKEDE
jgi:hypothetical protein